MLGPFHSPDPNYAIYLNGTPVPGSLQTYSGSGSQELLSFSSAEVVVPEPGTLALVAAARRRARARRFRRRRSSSRRDWAFSGSSFRGLNSTVTIKRRYAASALDSVT